MSRVDLEALLVLGNKGKIAKQNIRSSCFCCRGGQQCELCSETGQDLKQITPFSAVAWYFMYEPTLLQTLAMFSRIWLLSSEESCGVLLWAEPGPWAEEQASGQPSLVLLSSQTSPKLAHITAHLLPILQFPAGLLSAGHEEDLLLLLRNLYASNQAYLLLGWNPDTRWVSDKIPINFKRTEILPTEVLLWSP